MSLEDAAKALELAWEEVRKYRRDGEALRLRDSCEKGWLAVVLATDALLEKRGYGRPSSYRERRELLRRLEREEPLAAELGLRDRFGARGYYLHVLGYHEGSLSAEEVEEELEKAGEYLRDVGRLLKKTESQGRA